MDTHIWGIIAVLVIICILLIWAYNRGVSYRNYVSEAFSTMDVYLKSAGIWCLI